MGIEESYNNKYYTDYNGPDYHNREEWLGYFRGIAARIVNTLHPKVVLDVGCAFGYLVEALHELGVEAWGIDISQYAISQTDPSISKYVKPIPAWEPLPTDFPNRYDLVISIETLEHVHEKEGLRILDRLCEYSDSILLSACSTFSDDKTHLNIQPPEYWVEKFSERNFYEVVSYDGTYISPQTILVQKKVPYTISQLAFDYKHILWIEQNSKSDLQKELNQLNAKIVELNNITTDLLAQNDDAIQKLSILKEIHDKKLLDHQHQLNQATIAYEKQILEFQEQIKLEKKTHEKQILEFQEQIDNGRKAHENQLLEYNNLIAQEREEVEKYRNSYDRIKQSRSWRFTGPLRRFGSYIRSVIRSGRRYWGDIARSELFNKNWYLESYPEVRGDPAVHYYRLGWKKGYDPSPLFSTNGYLERHADVRAASINPLWHYIRFGKQEGRSISMQQPGPVIDIEETNKTNEPSKITLRNKTGIEILESQQKEITPEHALLEVSQLTYTPLISILMPMFNPELHWLQEALLSLQKQYYTNWELCITDDGSSDTRGIEFIRKVAAADVRIKLHCRGKNDGISAASNDSLNYATGDYIALMDQDDALPPDALLWVAKVVQNNPDIDFIYTDECKVDTARKPNYSGFFFKPDWSPEMMINFMYTGHLTIYKKELVDKVGGFRSEFDYSQDYDLALRSSEYAKKIHHIERILYFWRTLPSSGSVGGKEYALKPTILALKSHYQRQGVEVIVTNQAYGRSIQIKDRASPKISIIIPTDNEKNILDSIQILISSTTYPNYEIVIVSNAELCKNIEDSFPYYTGDLLRTVVFEKNSFNFSEKCNFGSSVSSGEVLIFLNDDALPNHSDWIDRMLDMLLLPGVGGVSPLMLYEDGRVQYAGIQAGQHICGLFGPSFHLMNIDDIENMIINPKLIRNVSVLSGACLMIRKSVFDEIGGFDSINTPNGHSDVDLSLRIWEAGYRCVYTPYSVFTHPGSGTWSLLGLKDKANIYAITRWKEYVTRDRYFTKSMRQYNLGSMILPYEFHLPNGWDPPKRNNGTVLLISHELSRTGAPVVAATAAKILKENDYFVVVASFREEPLIDAILADGIPVIIDQSIKDYRWRLPKDVPPTISHSIRGVIHDFDLVIVNTFVCHNIINCYNGTNVPLLWWLHEGYTSFADGNTRFMPTNLGNNVRVLSGGKYVQKVLKDVGIHYKTDTMLYGVEDCSTPSREKLQEKVRFIFPGSFEKRKNHKVLFEAIKKLTPESRANSDFICIGIYWEQSFYNELKKEAETINNLTLLDPIPYEDLMDLYDTCDCIVVPSIDDPMPVVLAEGMMLSKIVLSSNMTGTAQYIKDGINGYVFDCNNPEELSAKLEFIIKHRDQLECVKQEGRKVYEELFSLNAFQEKLLSEVKKSLNISNY